MCWMHTGGLSHTGKAPRSLFHSLQNADLALHHSQDYDGTKIVAGVDLLLRFTLAVLGLENDNRLRVATD